MSAQFWEECGKRNTFTLFYQARNLPRNSYPSPCTPPFIIIQTSSPCNTTAALGHSPRKWQRNGALIHPGNPDKDLEEKAAAKIHKYRELYNLAAHH
jgi:hypothetical protein